MYGNEYTAPLSLNYRMASVTEYTAPLSLKCIVTLLIEYNSAIIIESMSMNMQRHCHWATEWQMSVNEWRHCHWVYSTFVMNYFATLSLNRIHPSSPSKFTPFCDDGFSSYEEILYFTTRCGLFRAIWVIIEFRSLQLRPSQMGTQ